MCPDCVYSLKHENILEQMTSLILPLKSTIVCTKMTNFQSSSQTVFYHAGLKAYSCSAGTIFTQVLLGVWMGGQEEKSCQKSPKP